MRFFRIVGVTLFVILVLNVIQVSLELSLRDPVYACKEVKITDPIDVRKLCKRKIA